MKKYTILTVLSLVTLFANGQEIENPIDYLSGDWVRKVTNVTPKQTEEPWRGQTAYVEYKEVLNGKGLHQISYEGLNEAEAHFFYDAPSQKMYGMTIDANGYVWQSELTVNGATMEITGTAINDPSAKEVVQLTIVDATEMNFVYTMFKENKKILTAEGSFLRVPKH